MNNINIKFEKCVGWLLNNFCKFNIDSSIDNNYYNYYVHDNYKIIKLKDLMNSNSIDYTRNKFQIFNMLNQLTNAPILSDEKLNNILSSQNEYNLTFAYIHNSKIKGIITIIIEKKLINNGFCVAHIEDFVVDKEYRNQTIGKILIQFAIKYASLYNCYKVILDCGEDLVEYYKKKNFFRNGVCMRYYLPVDTKIIA